MSFFILHNTEYMNVNFAKIRPVNVWMTQTESKNTDKQWMIEQSWCNSIQTLRQCQSDLCCSRCWISGLHVHGPEVVQQRRVILVQRIHFCKTQTDVRIVPELSEDTRMNGEPTMTPGKLLHKPASTHSLTLRAGGCRWKLDRVPGCRSRLVLGKFSVHSVFQVVIPEHTRNPCTHV